ncbi:hypothetical protein DL764_001076 [Monosporascus ibericus]|uniref:Uncharacterized protein n=1 Tax=Monosporascus ibericus TaxID=155417 RepID=A0A4Q4TSS2_9PEZI|nr:hypothetical protein DL764_001076 [Monosporascus ibericus]
MSFPLDPHRNSQSGSEKPMEQPLTSCMDCWVNGTECEFTHLLSQETTVVGCLECAGAGSHCYVPVSDLPLLQFGLHTAVSGKRPIARWLASEEGRSPLSPPSAPWEGPAGMLEGHEILPPDPEGLDLSLPCPSTKADTEMTDRENRDVSSMNHITPAPQTPFDPWVASTPSQWPAEIWESHMTKADALPWCARCVGLGLECYGFQSGGDCYRCQRENVACVSLYR